MPFYLLGFYLLKFHFIYGILHPFLAVYVCCLFVLWTRLLFDLIIFYSFILNSSICGLINFIMNSFTLWTNNLVPLWTLLINSSTYESVHL